MLLCAHGLCPANQAEPGLLTLTSTSFAHYPTLQARFAMPLQPHRPPLFCPLSPEAYLLTGKGRK
ncbi:hypothetical protein [Mucilaginibacter sp. SG564]|uniref:hypothetical protein n=1 Tax=unclassified Mucilaginibacter TaxID=2617802 RepID=UPI0015575C25|nr:hypothetical protein [Mucilaginibacter sp. SG564]NOW94645.1 hypothetical protein [Mucilaginibacter sp. SG564]